MSNVDPWVVQPPKQAEQVPDGMYTAEFQGVVAVMLNEQAKWRFEWTVKTGSQAGKIASALTDASINPNTLAGRLISGLLGRPIVPGENVKDSIDACIGKPYVVSVAKGPQGGKPGVKSCGSPPPM